MARGDHIKVRRWRGVYAHHGIDMGDGTVIHLAGEPLHGRGARVCRTDMAAFLRGRKAIRVPDPDGARTPDEVVRAAEGHLSRAGYCLWRNNCEHFATFCKIGRPHSRQVLRALRIAGVATGALCVLAAGVLHGRSPSRGT